MASVNTYLSFKGNCEEAFIFYKAAFGGEFSHISRFKDMPKDESDCKVNDNESDKIMHISLPIGDTTLMGCDVSEEWKSKVTEGNNFSISILAESKDEANQLFESLSEGGYVIMPMDKTFWDSYFGMFTDKFGIQWMVSFYAHA